MRAEWKHLWTRTWQIAGRESDVRNVGDYFRYNVGPESLIIVRSEDQSLRAFYNTCQHRGTRLVTEDFGNRRTFRCPFHSWSWKINGQLAHLTDRETFREQAAARNLDLPEVRVDTWGGFVFICMDDKAPPLHEYLSVLPKHLEAYQFERMVVVKDVEVEWPVNWKTALDAFLESYHVHAVHSEILPFYDDYHQQWDLYENGMSRMLMMFSKPSPRVSDQRTVNPVLQAILSEVGIDPQAYTGDAQSVRADIQAAKMRQGKERFGYDVSGYSAEQMTDDWAYFVFPNVTLNIHPEGALVQRFRPHPDDPEKTIYDVTVLMHPIQDPTVKAPAYMGVDDDADCSGKTRPARRYLTPGDGGLGFVLEQDGALLPRVQAGLRSRGFRGAVLSEQEQRIRHYHAEIARYLNRQKW